MRCHNCYKVVSDLDFLDYRDWCPECVADAECMDVEDLADDIIFDDIDSEEWLDE